MFADSVLPDDVQPRGQGPEKGLLDGRAILITGATGFLGGRLAADLLARTERAPLLHRPPGPGRAWRATVPASDRSRRQRQRRSPAVSRCSTRICRGRGSVSTPTRGVVSPGRSIACCTPGPASTGSRRTRSLRGANVHGTLELLRLACLATPIPFHFVSSLSVCYAVNGPAHVDEAFDPLPHLRGVHLGYAQTKMVAEALVREAGRRGLPIAIYRPSLIAGDSRTGAFNADDLLTLLIRGCVQMGMAPDLDWALDCEPVDVVSAGILALSNGSATTSHI